MKQKITCPCENSFTVEVDEEIDLDQKPDQIEEILNGTFMTFFCPSCGKKHKPEFPVTLQWLSKKIRIEVLPELDRGEYYRRKKDPPGTETVIGYPEMADRLSVIQDGLEPAAIEALKYLLQVKAEETYPDAEISIWYQGKGSDSIEFHIHGIKALEVAVTHIPLHVYEKTVADFIKHPKNELFSSLRKRSYLSIQNNIRPEALK
jgi:hypothetical protein